MVKLVDTSDLRSDGLNRAGSSPVMGIKYNVSRFVTMSALFVRATRNPGGSENVTLRFS